MTIVYIIIGFLFSGFLFISLLLIFAKKEINLLNSTISSLTSRMDSLDREHQAYKSRVQRLSQKPISIGDEFLVMNVDGVSPNAKGVKLRVIEINSTGVKFRQMGGDNDGGGWDAEWNVVYKYLIPLKTTTKVEPFQLTV